jgi:hypothetical protein
MLPPLPVYTQWANLTETGCQPGQFRTSLHYCYAECEAGYSGSGNATVSCTTSGSWVYTSLTLACSGRVEHTEWQRTLRHEPTFAFDCCCASPGHGSISFSLNFNSRCSGRAGTLRGRGIWCHLHSHNISLVRSGVCPLQQQSNGRIG